MRFLLLALVLVGCNRELSLEPVQPPKAWTKTISADPHVVLRDLGVEYRERKDAAITTYKSPAGDQLRVITVRSQVSVHSLLARLANERGVWPKPHTKAGAFTVETIRSLGQLHVGFEIAPEPSDNPDAVDRAQIMIATCTPAHAVVPAMTDNDPCVRAIHKSIDAVKSSSDNWWVYSYIIGLIFAALVLGRWLQLGRRLLPPKGPSGLPVARVR